MIKTYRKQYDENTFSAEYVLKSDFEAAINRLTVREDKCTDKFYIGDIEILDRNIGEMVYKIQDLSRKLEIARKALEGLVKSEVICNADFIGYSEAYLNAVEALKELEK